MISSGLSVTSDLVVSIPRPNWHSILLTLCHGSFALFWLAFGFKILADLSTFKYATPTNRLLSLGLVGVSWLNGMLQVWTLRRILKNPLAILRSGIEVQGVKMPWSKIEYCRWGRYAPSKLEVHADRSRLYFSIPGDQRATVEATLRDLGKWQC